MFRASICPSSGVQVVYVVYYCIWFSALGVVAEVENRVLRRIFGPKRDKVTRESGEIYILRSLLIYTPHPILFG